MDEHGSLDDFIEKVFDSSVKPRNSIMLSLDTNHLPPNTDANDFIFKELLQIFIGGCKLRYGQNILLEHMIGSRLEKMQDYFASFGYKLYVDSEPETNEPRYKTDDKEVLKDYYLKINRKKVNYYIYFDYLE